MLNASQPVIVSEADMAKATVSLEHSISVIRAKADNLKEDFEALKSFESAHRAETNRTLNKLSDTIDESVIKQIYSVTGKLSIKILDLKKMESENIHS